MLGEIYDELLRYFDRFKHIAQGFQGRKQLRHTTGEEEYADGLKYLRRDLQSLREEGGVGNTPLSIQGIRDIDVLRKPGYGDLIFP